MQTPKQTTKTNTTQLTCNSPYKHQNNATSNLNTTIQTTKHQQLPNTKIQSVLQ